MPSVSDHGASIAAEQDGSVKKEDFINQTLTQGGGRNLAAALDEHVLEPALGQLLEQRGERDSALGGGQGQDLDIWPLEQAPPFCPGLGGGDKGGRL